MNNWSVNDSVENGFNTVKTLLQREGGQCANCPSVQNITIDHIIPQSFLLMLGFTNAYKEKQNLQFLCNKCNSRKGNSLDYLNPKTQPLLVMYVNRWIDTHDRLELKRNTRKITARCMCHPTTVEVPEIVKKPGLAPVMKASPKFEVDQYNW